MVEKQPGGNPELAEKVEVLKSPEIRERAQDTIDTNAEKSPDTQGEVESVLNEALKQAISSEVDTDDSAEKVDQKSAEELAPTRQNLDKSFNKTMTTIRKDMSRTSQAFSKVIHNPVVEKTSQAVGNTVARPNLIIAGALGTLILCSIIYIISKRYGYVLSGFEAIGTFVLGWAIGAIVEFIRVGLLNKKA